MDLNHIGLEKEKTSQLAKELNNLLSDYSVLYQNVRGYHWNVRGEKFFELHLKFEELYNDLILKIDEIAERILTLGHVPQNNFSLYLKDSDISETTDTANGVKAMGNILEALNIIIRKQRNILALAADAADEGTNALMSDYIREQEKLTWMYSAFLNK